MFIRFHLWLRYVLPVAGLLAALAAPAAAQVRAARKAQLVEPVAADDDDDPADVGVPQPVFVFADENFDQWLYQDMQNAAGARSRLDARLLMRLDDLAQSCDLTEAQRQKLHLAGRGDIRRLFDRIEELRRKFQAVRSDQNRIGEILQAMQPLQLAMRTGMFGETSLFAKALRSTLTTEQVERVETADRERRSFRYRAVVAGVVARLDDDLSLRAAQRRQLEQVLLDETRAPAHFSQYDPMVVLVQAARLPEDKLKPLFDGPQWKILKRQLDQALGVEPFLKANGFHPDSDPAAGARPVGMQPVPAALPIRRVFDVPARGF
ncbi:MAG: hypothetical protein ACM3U2_19320 [Deltaproteobacteria bacterium]